MEDKHRTSFLIGFLFVIAGLLAKSIYRDFIISRGIDDFGLAGSLPSLLYVIGFSQLLMIRPVRYPALTILVVSTGSVIYEYKQYLGSHLLDINDIIASVLGGILSLIILRQVEKWYRNQNNQNYS
jgi:hypothetical protein